MTPDTTSLRPDSWLVATGRASEPGTPLNVPLMPASNFIIGGDRAHARDDGTPTWEALEKRVGGLEAGRPLAFASDMAAIAAVFDQLHAVATVVLPDDCYQGVAGLVTAGAQRGRWAVRRVGLDDTAGWIDACRTADLVWLESSSNPPLGVADLEAIRAAPRKPSWPLQPSTVPAWSLCWALLRAMDAHRLLAVMRPLVNAPPPGPCAPRPRTARWCR